LGIQVDPFKKKKLDETVATLQARWGSQAIRRERLEKSPDISCIPTTFPALDDLLANGGLPVGRVSEIIGTPTSGMATMAIQIIARAQQNSQSAVYIDPEKTFDPAYAVRLGVTLDRLILVRPNDLDQALNILRDLVLYDGISLNPFVFQIPVGSLNTSRSASSLAQTLERIIAPLGRSQSVLLFLTSLPTASTDNNSNKHHTSIMRAVSAPNYPGNGALPHFSTVRLYIHRERWIYKNRDIKGFRAQVEVIKNKLGPAGQRAFIKLDIPDEL
jgi:recombination protein RecA